MLLWQANCIFKNNNMEKHLCWGKMGAGWELDITVNYSYYAGLAQILSLVIALAEGQP